MQMQNARRRVNLDRARNAAPTSFAACCRLPHTPASRKPEVRLSRLHTAKHKHGRAPWSQHGGRAGQGALFSTARVGADLLPKLTCGGLAVDARHSLFRSLINRGAVVPFACAGGCAGAVLLPLASSVLRHGGPAVYGPGGRVGQARSLGRVKHHRRARRVALSCARDTGRSTHLPAMPRPGGRVVWLT